MSGMHRGFGFCTFEKPEMMDACVRALNGAYIM